MKELSQGNVVLVRFTAFIMDAFLGMQVLFAVPILLAHEPSALSRGQITATVVCTAEPSQSYALYLPSNYTADRRWPILYAFDPAARGRVAVETFQEAAEKCGYIVVGSNNSRNGPWEPNLAAIRALWTDTHTRFSLDERRIYTTGFSGGARVAVSIGEALTGQVAGVIACGAGFPLAPSQKPGKGTPFVFFATAGIRDFNFRELRELDKTLASLGLTHRLEVFNGGHQWAPKELAAEALEWMEIQAMKSGRRDKDDSWVAAIYAAHWDKARRLDESGDIAQAFHHYEELAADFQGLRDVSEAEARLRDMKGSKVLDKALKLEKKREARIASLESDYDENFNRVMAEILGPSSGEHERRQAMRALRLREFQQLETNKKDTPESIAAERYVRGVLVHVMEEGTTSMNSGDFTRAKIDLEIAAECAPDNGFVLYQLARAYALSKDKRSALSTLRRSVENGFSDLDELEKNPDFASLRGEPGYAGTIAMLKKRWVLSSPVPH